MADMIEQKISDPEPWTNKILCRYREAPPIKQFLREGEDRVLVAEITRLRQLLSEAEKREREARAKALEEAAQVAEAEYKRHCTGSGFDSQPARSTAHRILEALKALQSEER
ncbi:hypothetical protein [Rhizobium sp. P007]|uniref:hypothetical protein n=1 Tax=Rhizobium sp. P007 TaxID=285908 RepID=UPI00115A0981|nr:hypothetical protein [Rhizobium sp. P007]CAD7033933.1 hypothetical protein RP007_04182 [Rhizobium sp. P007]